MKTIQKQVHEKLLDGCEDCGAEVKIVGNGSYAAPRCTDTDCRWFLTVDRAVELVHESDEYSVK